VARSIGCDADGRAKKRSRTPPPPHILVFSHSRFGVLNLHEYLTLECSTINTPFMDISPSWLRRVRRRILSDHWQRHQKAETAWLDAEGALLRRALDICAPMCCI
jgi:hypothetical protein